MATPVPISFGIVNGTPVFMDIARDCYFRLEHDEECAFLASLKKIEQPFQPIVHGFVRSSERHEWRLQPICLPPPATCALPSGAESPKISKVLSVARLLLAVRRALRTLPIAAILSPLSRPASGNLSTDFDPIASASEFRNARRLVPISGNCLSESLGLIRWLAEHGGGATLVFGVKLDPFAAHCWIESRDTVLNDHPERVGRFTRVRTIECAPATR
ncbi:MAG TPA: lasso peptide biosynthesis B2 protein [Sphingomicrobium sp.]|jgi:hypothetical protein|nr:lasso peptide biosynthesis B2 protein [Sphingomicrobium sp.]